MKIRFKIDQRPDYKADRTKYSTVAVLQIAVKYDGYLYSSAETTETIAERVFLGTDDHGYERDQHQTEEAIAEWAAKTIANLLRPLVAAEDRPKDD